MLPKSYKSRASYWLKMIYKIMSKNKASSIIIDICITIYLHVYKLFKLNTNQSYIYNFSTSASRVLYGKNENHLVFVSHFLLYRRT